METNFIELYKSLSHRDGPDFRYLIESYKKEPEELIHTSGSNGVHDLYVHSGNIIVKRERPNDKQEYIVCTTDTFEEFYSAFLKMLSIDRWTDKLDISKERLVSYLAQLYKTKEKVRVDNFNDKNESFSLEFGSNKNVILDYNGDKDSMFMDDLLEANLFSIIQQMSIELRCDEQCAIDIIEYIQDKNRKNYFIIYNGDLMLAERGQYTISFSYYTARTAEFMELEEDDVMDYKIPSSETKE